MDTLRSPSTGRVRQRMVASHRWESPVSLAACAFGVLVMANIGAVVDWFFHPEISYFDSEHIIVGGVTALVCTLLLAGLAFYLRALASAEARIRNLESVMPICMYCKKIRRPGLPAESMESWQNIETFVHRKFDMDFSHGVCPVCMDEKFSAEDAA